MGDVVANVPEFSQERGVFRQLGENRVSGINYVLKVTSDPAPIIPCEMPKRRGPA